MEIRDIELPEGVHAVVLTDRDIVTGEPLAYPIVWADRSYNTCPTCGEPIDVKVDRPPAMLNAGAGLGGQIEEWSKQHGCGTWLSVSWQQVTGSGRDTTGDDDEGVPGISETDILAAAAELAADRQQKIADEQRAIQEQLRAQLATAIAWLDEPLDDGQTREDRADDVTTGSQTEPGVYYEEGVGWIAWAYDPLGVDPVTVAPADLRTATNV